WPWELPLCFILCGQHRRETGQTKAAEAKPPPHSCAFERSERARWKSLPGLVWNPETKGNCVLARGGGEQPKVNIRSVAQANSIRPAAPASPRVNGEALMASARS